MLRIITVFILIFFGCTEPAPAGDAVIFNGPRVKALKSAISLNDVAYILTGTVDPSAVATDAPEGSLFIRNNAGGDGQVYWKLDAGSTTNWTLIAASVTELVTDLTPQLGGDLDLNGQNIDDGVDTILMRTDKGAAQESIYLGRNAGNPVATGDFNVGMGRDACNIITTGASNVCVGVAAGAAMTGGLRNTYLGESAGAANVNGDQNTALGYNAGRFHTGNNGTFIGYNAGRNTTGTNNTSLGHQAGDTNTTGSALTIIGRNADVSATGLSNATAIGDTAIVDASNKFRFGSDTVTVAEWPGGIEHKTPDSTVTGDFDVVTGDASAGDSGDINLTTGTATGTRGVINLDPGFAVGNETFSDYDENDVSTTFTGAFTAGQTVTIRYRRSGKTVTMSVPIIRGACSVSSTISTGATDIPANMRPAFDITMPMAVHDNGADQTTAGLLSIVATGLVGVALDLNAASFTAASNCGSRNGFTVSWTVD